jgi:serine/threonine protein phosphatase PrpC
MSNRKPHNQDAGYIAERQFNGSHIVIYLADAQGFDVGGCKYAVVCSKHSTLWGATSLKDARGIMKHPEFCETCMGGYADSNLR